MFIRFRPWRYFFYKNWYCWRKMVYPYTGTYHFILDIGAITIGRRRKGK